MKKAAFYFYILSLLSTDVANANFTSEIFEPKSDRKKVIFTCISQGVDKDGLTETKTSYTDSTGNLAIEETAQAKGATLIRYEIDQRQIGVKASVEVKGDEIVFEKRENSKTKKESEKLKSPLVISSTFASFVKEHWSELNEGKTIGFRFASWERMETVGFEIKKIGNEILGSDPTVKIKMSASSFIIAAIVSPLNFWFAEDGSKLLEMKGRVAPKWKQDSSWKDLDAEVVYHHQK